MMGQPEFRTPWHHEVTQAFALLMMRCTSSREALERVTGWDEKLTAGAPVERRMSYNHHSDSFQKHMRSISAPVTLLPEVASAELPDQTVAGTCGDWLSADVS